MAADWQLKWYGDQIVAELEKDMPDALFEAASLFIDTAKAKAPPDRTGTLRESGYVATEKRSTYKSNKQHFKEVQPPKGGAVAGFAAFYARFVEFGTKKGVRARPFIRPAFDEVRGQMVEVAGDKLKIALKRMK